MPLQECLDGLRGKKIDVMRGMDAVGMFPELLEIETMPVQRSKNEQSPGIKEIAAGSDKTVGGMQVFQKFK